MRKKKIILSIIGLIITTLCTITITNAETIATKLTIKSTNYTKTKITFPETFHVKKTSSGKFVYCLTYAKKTPSSGITYTRGAFVNDAGKVYILKEAYDNVKNNDDFFIYQTALWIYMQDKGIMAKSNSVTAFKTKVNNSTSATATKIKSIVAKAKTASKMDTTDPTITLTASNTNLTLDGDNYVSEKIKLTSSEKNYKITLVNAPKNTTYKVSNGYLYISVPKTSISKINNEFEIKVSNSKILYKSYDFKPSSSSYQIMAATFKYTKTASASLKLNITKNVELSIDKIDADSTKSLSGAKIVVKDENNKTIDSWTSKTSAHVIKNLTKGTYTIEEIQAPDGYILSKKILKFTVDEDGKITDEKGNAITKVELANTKNKVEISKQDITTNTELPGAKLVLKDEDNKEIDSWTSSDQPHKIEGLKAGSYILSETQTPAGYVITKETIKFTIDENGKIIDKNGNKIEKVVMYNTPQKEMNIKISKQDITSKQELPGATLTILDKNGKVVETWVSEETEHTIKYITAGTYTLKETIAPNGYILSEEAIKFTIDKDGNLTDEFGKAIDKVIMYNQQKKENNIEISKQDIATNKELPGANLTITDKNNNIIDTWISTNTPHKIKNLEAGTYVLTETQAPDGYTLSKETIKFTIDKNGTLTDESGKTIDKIIMYNKKENKPLEVTISKQDITTSKELPGATLTVKDNSGKTIDTWISTNEAHKIQNIKAGTYTLTETQAPNGYILSTETITFTINEAGKVTDKDGNSIEKVVMFNTPIKKIDVTISKQDITTSKELPGATLTVKDSSGKTIDTWTSTDEAHIIKSLEDGTYTLTETQAPNGYILSTETITFIISDGKLQNKDHQNIDKVIMYNEKEQTKEKVNIIKQDSITHENIKGAHLEVKDEVGNKIDSWISTQEAHTLELKAGTYTLTETQAPDGYKIEKETITFHITEDGKLTDENGQSINSIIVNNTPTKNDTGSVTISKQDITNGKELPGAHLVVKDKNGNVIDEWTSTDKPHLIENLTPGTYTLNEVIAPNGYILSDETITFTVKDDKTIDTVVMYNQPKTTPNNPNNNTTTPDKPSTPPNNTSGTEIEVENTSSTKNLITSIIGGITAIAGTISIAIKKKILFQ